MSTEPGARMSHDAAFARLRARRDRERRALIKVTWRKVSDLTGGGWSGLGPDGNLVWVAPPVDLGVVTHDYGEAQAYDYGEVVGSAREKRGTASTLFGAKQAAKYLLKTTNNGGSPAREEASMAPTTPTLEARAVKLKTASWQPAVFAEGDDAPVETAPAVRTKKEAEELASNLLDAVISQVGTAEARHDRPERPSEAAMREADAMPVRTYVVREDGTLEEETIEVIPTTDSLIHGLRGVKASTNPKGTYHRITAGNKALAYANPRKNGVLLDFVAKAVEGVDTPGIEVKGARALLHVTAANVAEARALLEHLARA